ncbi:ASST-domain-containing protein [Xylariaceae sp. FL0804]|nr:ASST-domain-containing protein [Xylariaceae sp. FL0804]
MRLPCVLLTAAAGFSARAFAGPVSGSPAYVRDDGYDRAAYGRHPSQQFQSAAELEAPQVNILQWDKSCETSLLTLMTPRGAATGSPQATMLDHRGGLVWTSGWKGQQIYNLMVQPYKGKDYLTFWSGDDGVGGHGAGTVQMLDHEYQHFKQIRAAGGLDADLHDFQITKDDTALITVYEIVQMDLSSVGKRKHGPVWDCLVQEIDIETGDLLFEWRASDFWSLTDSYRNIGNAGENGEAYDFYHINSIDKDAQGNYLVSSRYTRSMTYINGTDGEVLWIMGGRRNMFRDLSGGIATNFAYQHDARWSDGGRTITLFDNAVWDGDRDRADTRGLKITVDQEAMTAALVAQYLNPLKVHGVSQGSFQSLANGNVLLGYGNTAAYTEYAGDGRPLCDIHFAPQSRFGTGDLQSYRVYKYEWHGWPTTPPAAVLAHDAFWRYSVYVSWNGATEVARWTLQGAASGSAPEEDWAVVAAADRTDFETRFEHNSTYPPYLRVVATNAAGNTLGVSDVLDGSSLEYHEWPDASAQWSLHVHAQGEDGDWGLHALVAFCGVLIAGVVARTVVVAWNGSPRLRRKWFGEA